MLDKHAAIRTLFNAGWEQKDIARILKLTEVTVSKHVIKGDMRKKRIEFGINKQTSEENALAALAHQTKVIRLISEKLGEKVQDDLSVEELSKLLISKGEIDAVQKLFTTVKGKELDWSAMVQVIRNLMAYIKETDLELAQELIPHIDEYINEKRRSM
jgi:transcriptional regulator